MLLNWKDFEEVGVEANDHRVIFELCHLIQTLNPKLSAIKKELNDFWWRIQLWLAPFGLTLEALYKMGILPEIGQAVE